MARWWLISLLIAVAGLGLAAFVLAPSWPFNLGLDLAGGSQLVYEADVSALPPAEVDEAMNALRGVIERRIGSAAVAGTLGVLEPVIQVEQSGFGANAKHRLIVELPGVTDLGAATEFIKSTPLLEFGLEDPTNELFAPTKLNGRYLKRAQVEFTSQSIGPSISIEFNKEGADIFAELTKNNVGRRIGIFLDGVLLSAPAVREPILSGQAAITGEFTLDEARSLTRNLNLGALPVPIQLVATETVGPSLGADALARGIKAGAIGLAAVALFMILWYRLPGLLSILSLSVYVLLVLAMFKIFGVTITAAGIAGLILSFGMALDANILISERLKEELRAGRGLAEAIRDGFARAWLAIRDSNFSSLISALVLFWFGTTLIKGFAVTLALGIVMGLITSIWVTKCFLFTVTPTRPGRLAAFLFRCGFK